MAKPTFKANPIQVQVPATSANLGPGFDAFGLAFSLHDRYVAQILDEGGLDIDVTGEGADELPRNEKHLLVKAMYKGFDFLGGKPKGLAVRALNVIPHGRGLGSSAAAIIGGLVLARSLVLTGTDKMSDTQLLNLATEMEGHPDNVAAALFGGATVAWTTDVKAGQRADAIHLPVDPRIQVMAFIPATSKLGAVYTDTGAVALRYTVIDGQTRKVVTHFARNGFFYTLDRTNGKFLKAAQRMSRLLMFHHFRMRWIKLWMFQDLEN